jgi:flagellar biosynthetic protein FliR
VAQPLNLLLGIALFAALFGTILSQFADASIGWIQLGWR